MTTKATRRTHLAQRLANSYPSWSAVRNDIESIGWQFFNSLGGIFDDFVKQVKGRATELYLASSPVNDLDTCYKLRLPEDFIFTKKNENDTELNYESPTVSGQVSSTYYQVSLAEDNEVENFWRSAVPSRLEYIESKTGTDAQYLVASGFAFETFLNPLVTELSVPSRLFITTVSGEQYIGISDTNEISRGLVQIIGESRYGVELTEELIFLHDDKQPTQNEFAIISGIYVRSMSNRDDIHVSIRSMDFNSGPYSTAYQLEYDKDINEDVPSFWDLGEGITPNTSTLDYVLYEHPELEVRVGGFPLTYAAIRQDLLDLAGNAVSAMDMAVQGHSDHLLVVDNSKLYYYSAFLPYMNLKSLKGRSSYRACEIRTDGDYVINGDTLTLEFVWIDSSKGLKRHQVLAEHEDGTKYAVTGGILTSYSSSVEYWEFGEPLGRYLRAPVEIILPKTGIFTFSLHAVLGDDTTEIDKRVIVSSPQQSPLAEFDLSSLGITNNVEGIHIDADNYIWILDNVGTIHKLERHYDTMLIDYRERTIYFRENYDKVFVEEGSE